MRRLAHRGLHDTPDRPENSPEAIRAAWASGADGLEVDLQMLGDGRIVTHHDPVLRLAPGREGRHRALADLDREDFRRLSDVPAMTLPELLGGTPEHQQLVLEGKPQRSPGAFRRRLLRVLHRHDVPPKTLVSSVDLSWLRELAPSLPVPVAPVVHRVGPLERAALEHMDWREIHLWEGLCTRTFLKELRTRTDRPVVAWTVNDPGRVDELDTLGVEGIMTDRPDLLVPPDASTARAADPQPDAGR